MQETGPTWVPRQRMKEKDTKKQSMSQSLLYYMGVFIVHSR